MIPIYTRYDLSMDVCGTKYYLPFPFDDNKDVEIIEKTVKLFSEANIYERKLYESMIKKPSVSYDEEYKKINVKCLYEGYDEYYPFTIVLEVFRFNCEDKNEKEKYMVALTYEHRYGGLLDELIEDKSIPKIVSSTNLKRNY